MKAICPKCGHNDCVKGEPRDLRLKCESFIRRGKVHLHSTNQVETPFICGECGCLFVLRKIPECPSCHWGGRVSVAMCDNGGVGT